MKQKIICLLAVLLGAAAQSVWAQNPDWLKPGDGWDEASGTLTVNSLPDNLSYKQRGSIKHVVIPDAVTGQIASSAFHDCGGIKTVVIGDGVTAIGEKAFCGCSALVSAMMGKGVTSIGAKSFYKCEYLKTLTISPAVTTIGDDAFNGCLNLQPLIILPSVKSIGNRAFYYCAKLNSVIIGAGIETVGAEAFGGEWEGFHSITFLREASGSDNLPSLGENVFTRLYGELTIYVLDGSQGAYQADTEKGWNQVTDQDILALSDWGTCGADGNAGGAASVKWALCDGDGDDEQTKELLLVWGTGAMADYVDATSAPWAGKRDDIKSGVVSGGVTRVGNHAFSKCGNMTAVTLPASVSAIGDEAFASCGKLATVTVPHPVSSAADVPTLSDNSKAFDGNASGRLIFVPAGSVATYQSATGFNYYCFSDGEGLVNPVEDKLVCVIDKSATKKTFRAYMTSDAGVFPKENLTVETEEDPPAPVAYIDADGKLHNDLNGSTETTDDDGAPAIPLDGTETTLGEDGKTTWYVCQTPATENGGKGLAYSSVLTVKGDVHLILADGSKMTVEVSKNESGVINGDKNSRVSIYGQSTGDGMGEAYFSNTIEASSDGIKVGAVRIHGGIITAVGEKECGIWALNGDVTITGGNVTATGLEGIHSNQNVSISGGIVKASGSNYGIFSYGDVSITGGQVTASVTGDGESFYAIFADQCITLGWTNSTDFIEANSYGGRRVTASVAPGQRFVACEVTGNGSEATEWPMAIIPSGKVSDLATISGYRLRPCCLLSVSGTGVSVVGKDAPDLSIGTTPYYKIEAGETVTIASATGHGFVDFSATNTDGTDVSVDVADDGTVSFKMPANDVTVVATASLWAGKGTEASPYQIATPEDLCDLAVYVNGAGTYSDGTTETFTHDCTGLWFRLENDIDFAQAETEALHPKYAWDPYELTYITGWYDFIAKVPEEANFPGIGYYGDSSPHEHIFNGHFLGNRKTISGLRIYMPDNNFVGLFGIIGANGSVEGITITNACIFGESTVGGIVGWNKGTVTSCHTTIDVIVRGYLLGGIAGGTSNQSKIESCACSAFVHQSGNSPHAGGIAGAPTGELRGNLFTDGWVSDVDKLETGAIAGFNYGYGTGNLANNYYANYKYGETNVGCGNDKQNDVTENDGAVHGYKVFLGDGITATGEHMLSIDVPLFGVTTTRRVAVPGSTVTIAYTGTDDFYGFSVTGATVNESNGVYTFEMPSHDAIVGLLTPVAYIDADGKLHDDLDGSTPETDDDGALAFPLTGKETTLGADGKTTWYVCQTPATENEGKGLAYSSVLTVKGDVHLILADGAKMTVEMEGNRTGAINGDTNSRVSFYGQSTGDGMGTAYFCNTSERYSDGVKVGAVGIYGGNVTAVGEKEYGIWAIHGDVTITSGNVTTNGDNSIYTEQNVNISGGTVTVNGIIDGIFGNNVSISGGQVTVSISDNGRSDSYAIIALQNITLGWTNGTDFIEADSYETLSGTVSVASGQRFVAFEVTGTGSEVTETPTAIIPSGEVEDPINGYRLRPLDGQLLTVNGTGASIAGKSESDLTIGATPYYIYKGGETVTLSPGSLYKFARIEGLPTGATHNDDGSVSFDMPDDDVVVSYELAPRGAVVNIPAGQFVTFYGDTPVTVEGQGVTLYYAKEVSDAAMTISPIGTAPARTPLLVRNDGTEAKTVVMVSTADPNVSLQTAPEFKGSVDGRTFTAADMAGADVFVCTGNALVWVKDPGTIAGGKCWVELAKGRAAQARIVISTDGTPTGMAGVGGQQSAPWYDLRGRRLDGRPTRKGVYLHGGSKVVVR